MKVLLKLFGYKTHYAICVTFVKNYQNITASLTFSMSPWLCVENYDELQKKLNDFYGVPVAILSIFKI